MRTREEQLTAMIHLYGMEHEATIQFAELMDKGWKAEDLEPIVKAHEEHPLYNEEDWD